MANGPATELIEATATSIGAGMLLGGFIGALLSQIVGPRSALAIVDWGTFGGVATAVALVVEIVLG